LPWERYTKFESMQYTAQRLSIIEPSPTLAITAKAAELRAQGRDIVGFGAGEPDFDTPEHIKEAARIAMAQGQTKYTAVGGTPALKKAVAEKFKRDNGLDYKPSEITIGTGGKQILYNLFLAYLNPGEEVIVPAPYWVSYADIVRLAGGVPVLVACPASQHYLMSPDQLEAAITNRTRAVLLNSPSNPTGAVYSADQLTQLAAVLERYANILTVTDDIYEHILFDGRKFSNLLSVAPHLRDRVFIANGVSKSYSMTGWRIGYGAGPSALIEGMETMQSQSTSNPSSISQAAAVAALNGPQACVEEMRLAFERRRNIVIDAFRDIPELHLDPPGGAFYVFPALGKAYQLPGFQRVYAATGDRSSSRVFAKILLERYDVAVVPGVAFGDDQGMRLSFALGDETLKKGLGRIAQMVRDMRS
jgi:aspartate aminotransferase